MLIKGMNWLQKNSIVHWLMLKLVPAINMHSLTGKENFLLDLCFSINRYCLRQKHLFSTMS